MTVAAVKMWGRRIGAVSLSEGERFARFQYDPAFLKSGIEVAPLTMPLSERVWTFPALPFETFSGLPGLLADSLPDRYGNALIDAWLARQGRRPGDFDAVERLCYTGVRGMGALEYEPSTGPEQASHPVDVAALVELASEVLSSRGRLSAELDGDEDHDKAALEQILRIGTSAGGARAKAVIAWNPQTGEIRSGQVDPGEGFEHWLLKFDGVSGNRDKELDDPAGYGAIEYAYHLMATAAGVEMMPCRLLEEHGRRHFMTQRFDRTFAGKLHMQSLCALAHFDFNAAGAYSYEQALAACRRLGLRMTEREELVRRMVFNVVARNQDDHVKNIAFLMNKRGEWSLSPAFDVTYSYNPAGAWTSQHQMSVNGKRDDFVLEDLRACARTGSLKRGRVEAILDEVVASVAQWPQIADEVGIPEATAAAIARTHRWLP